MYPNGTDTDSFKGAAARYLKQAARDKIIGSKHD
jgi:hypothetical protein